MSSCTFIFFYDETKKLRLMCHKLKMFTDLKFLLIFISVMAQQILNSTFHRIPNQYYIWNNNRYGETISVLLLVPQYDFWSPCFIMECTRLYYGMHQALLCNIMRNYKLILPVKYYTTRDVPICCPEEKSSFHTMNVSY